VRVAADVSELKTNMEQASSHIETGVSRITDGAKLIGEVFAGKEVLDKVLEFARESIDAFAQMEAAEMRLTVALGNSGQPVAELREDYIALASSLMDTTSQSQRALVASEALFTTMGKVGPAEMRNTLVAATDLAVFFDGDLRQATEVIIKASEGSTRGLKQLGIELDTTRIQGEGLPYVLGEIEKHVGGQAQAELETYAGKMEHLRSEWEKLQESFGKVIAAGEKQSGFLSGWSMVLDGVGASIDKFGLFATAIELSKGKLVEVVDAGTEVERQAQKAASALHDMADVPVDKLGAFEDHLKALSQSTSDLSPRLQDLILRAQELSVGVKDIAAGLGLSTEAVQAFIASHKQMTESLLHGQEIAEKYAKFWTRVREESVLFINNWVQEFDKAQLTLANSIAKTTVEIRNMLIEQRRAMGESVADLGAPDYNQTGDAQLDALSKKHDEQMKQYQIKQDMLGIDSSPDSTQRRQLQELMDNENAIYERAWNAILQKQAGFNTDMAAAVAAGAGPIGKAADTAIRPFESRFHSGFDSVKTHARMTVDEIAQMLNAADKMYKDAGFLVQPDLMMRAKQAPGSSVPSFFADGTNFAPGGRAIVGERGPELVNLPRGSQVIPNGSFGGGHTFNVQVVAGAGATAAEQGRQAADALAARLKSLGVRF
jgi:hypothetical protein